MYCERNKAACTKGLSVLEVTFLNCISWTSRENSVADLDWIGKDMDGRLRGIIFLQLSSKEMKKITIKFSLFNGHYLNTRQNLFSFNQLALSCNIFSLSWNQQSENRILYKLMGWLLWMVCRKFIQWYIFLLKLNHTRDWAWLLVHEVSRRTTVGRTPLDERSARHRDLYLTTHNTHKRQTPMPPVGFEPNRPQTYALDSAATGTGSCIVKKRIKYLITTNKESIRKGTNLEQPISKYQDICLNEDKKKN